jgi:Xaa-Pro dipeptidase
VVLAVLATTVLVLAISLAAQTGPDLPPLCRMSEETSAALVAARPFLDSPKKLLSETREAWRASWGEQSSCAAFLLFGSNVILKAPFQDDEYPFVQESNFVYLGGNIEIANATFAYVRTASGSWRTTLVVPQPTVDYVVWNGENYTKAGLAAQWGVDRVVWTAEVTPHWLADFGDGGFGLCEADQHVYLLPAVSPPSPWEPLANSTWTSEIFGSFFLDNNTTFIETLAGARKVKTAGELALLRLASSLTGDAHAHVMALSPKPTHEYEIEGAFHDFVESCGAMVDPYAPIVGGGLRAGILHYGANVKELTGDWVLMDAAIAIQHYASDVTRSWSVRPEGTYTSLERALYQEVLAIQTALRAAAVGPTSFTNLTAVATAHYKNALQSLGLTKSSAIPTEVMRAFAPHGLGHHIGLDTHDLDSATPAAYDSLSPGTVITIEPGLYINPFGISAMLAKHPEAKKLLDERRIEEFVTASVGGVRIEDVVRIRAGKEPEVLSGTAPRSIDEVERVLQEQL